MSAGNRARDATVDAGDYRRYLLALTVFHQAAADAVGLSGTDYQAANLLDLDGPLSNGDLARRLGLTTGATTRLIDRLIATGLAERTADPQDRRRALVAHTGVLPDGLGEILVQVRDPIGAVVASLTPAQTAGLATYFRGAAEAYGQAARALRAADPGE